MKWISVISALLVSTCAWADITSPWDSLEASAAWGFKTRIFAEGQSVYISNPAGVLVSHDRGDSWWKPTFAQSPQVVGIHIAGEKIFASAFDQGILYSSDRGLTWKRLVRPGGSGDTFCGAFFRDSALLAGSYYRGIHRSTDTGKTWVRAEGPTNTGVFNQFASLGNTILAASLYDGVHLSKDEGKTWQKATVTPGTAKSINTFAVESPRVFVANNNGEPFLSLDTCTSWRRINLDSGLFARSVAMWKGLLIVGTLKQGILFSDDQGDTWKKLGTALPDSLGVNNLAVGDGILYAATTDFALWRLELGPATTSLKKNPQKKRPVWQKTRTPIPKVNGRSIRNDRLP